MLISHRKEGFLDLVVGSMFSGKTEYLIDIYNKFKDEKKIFVINHNLDNRYDNNQIVSHNRNKIPVNMKTTNLSEISLNSIDNYHIFIINEGQFFPDLYEFVIQMVEQKGKIVHIAALDGDFKRNVFGEILQLIPRCDNYLKLHALCAKCRDGTNASFSHRISNEDKQISIGSDNYIPLCRKCYENLNILYSSNVKEEYIKKY